MSSTTGPSTSTSPSSPSWRFPGPSSRFNQRERPVRCHTRSNSAYTPTAPNLHTERRASHRRSQTQKSNILSTNSPPGEYARSPLSRFSSYTMAAAAPPNNAAPPSTPKSHRRHSSLHNSPFSDYFSDCSVDSNVPSNPAETKQLLGKMNKLQSHLMHDPSSNTGLEAIRIVRTKLDEVERAFSALHGQMNAPSFAGEDSAVFMDEEETLKQAHTAGRTEPYLDTVNGSMELPPEPTTIAEFRAERDWFILRTQELLDGLRSTQSELTKRFAEVRQLNEEHNAQIEERDTLIEQLRSENEGLRTDLGFEYSELLFLKLQMKSLEVDVDAIEDQEASAIAVSREQESKKNRILSEMDRWRSDWQDVKGRFKRRRSKYGVSPDRRDSLSVNGETATATGETEWHLHTVKEDHGRVTSLTIKRMDSTYGASAEESTTDTSDPFNIDSVLPSATPRASRHQDTDLEGHPTQGPDSEPQIAKSSLPHQQEQHTYVEHGTQTEPPTSQDEDEEDRLFPHEQNEDAEEEKGDDCAITTSSEASDCEEGATDIDTAPVATATQTAWQELWASLQNLTGIDDRFED